MVMTQTDGSGPSPSGSTALEKVNYTLQRLQIGRTKLYELIESEDIEAVHIGRHTRIVAESVDAYVARLRTDPVQIKRAGNAALSADQERLAHADGPEDEAGDNRGAEAKDRLAQHERRPPLASGKRNPLQRSTKDAPARQRGDAPGRG